jgi:hypothetical protein
LTANDEQLVDVKSALEGLEGLVCSRRGASGQLMLVGAAVE